jgi:CheY-like chemotaxis protein
VRQALISLVGDVLDLTKLESGALVLASLDFDVRTVVEQTAEIVAYRAREKGLEVVVLTRPDVPERLRGDPHRIRQVLLNFAGNAVKFTERGEVVVEVALDPDVRDGRVGLLLGLRLWGQDPPHRLDDCSAFHQLSPASHRAGGVGLGLAISRDLAERMGGRVGVSSVPGQGSTFHLSLVLERALTPSAPTDAPPRLDGRHVLLLDPSATSRFVLREQVKAWGAAPEEAADADDAVARIAHAASVGRPFALAVVDARALGTDVAGFAARVHATPGGARVALVLLTPMPTPRRLRTAGFAGYLQKPVRQRHLRGVLALALERSAAASVRRPDRDARRDEQAQRSRPASSSWTTTRSTARSARGSSSARGARATSRATPRKRCGPRGRRPPPSC